MCRASKSKRHWHEITGAKLTNFQEEIVLIYQRVMNSWEVRLDRAKIKTRPTKLAVAP